MVIWIAGVGASGLSAAVARRFAREHFVVALTGRTAERVEAVADEIRKAGGAAHAFAGDVSREAEALAIGDEVSALGPLEVAVFDAASAVRALSPKVTAGALEEALRTTTVGGFVFGREVVRRMLPLERGTLLFSARTTSPGGQPPFAAFAASKAALRSISRTLARELGPRGIHVAHVVIDGEPIRSCAPRSLDGDGPHDLGDIANVCWHLHREPRSAWTQEVDLRPENRPF